MAKSVRPVVVVEAGRVRDRRIGNDDLHRAARPPGLRRSRSGRARAARAARVGRLRARPCSMGDRDPATWHSSAHSSRSTDARSWKTSFARPASRRARADSVATFAVREAYRRRVPPALVFGVLMVENRELKSSATSNAGAVGLMQIDTSTWVSALGKHFGTNLRNDETNLRYGVFILSHLLYDSDDDCAGRLGERARVAASRPPALQRMRARHEHEELLPLSRDRAHAHRHTSRSSQCGWRGYERCVAEPLKYALDD